MARMKQDPVWRLLYEQEQRQMQQGGISISIEAGISVTIGAQTVQGGNFEQPNIQLMPIFTRVI